MSSFIARVQTGSRRSRERSSGSVGGEPEPGRLGCGLYSGAAAYVNIRAVASYVSRHHSPRPNRCQSIFVLPCMRRWPGHCSRLSAHKPDNGVQPETMPGVMQSRCDEERPCLVMRPFSVCVCLCLCAHYNYYSQSESRGKPTCRKTDDNGN